MLDPISGGQFQRGGRGMWCGVPPDGRGMRSAAATTGGRWQLLLKVVKYCGNVAEMWRKNCIFASD